MSRPRFFRRHSETRRGAAVAELAICLPLLVLLLLASIEACSMIFLEHGLSIASYEGVRAGISYDGTNADVQARCNEIITQRSIEDATISTNPGNVANVAKGEPITVIVSAPASSNMISPPWFFGGKTLTARTTMVKE